jgi:thioesterase domain-containing protein
MSNIQEVTKSLELSTGSVYRRLERFNGDLDKHVKRGSKNELLFDGEALAMLRRVEDIRKAQRISIKRAIITVQQELDGNHDSTTRRTTESRDRLVEILQRESKHLRQEVIWLREKIDRLTPLALPRRRGWLPWRRAREG